MEPRTFSVSEVLGQGWAYFKKHWMFALIIIGAGIVIDIIGNIFAPSELSAFMESQLSNLDSLTNNPERQLEALAKIASASQVSTIVSYLVKTIIYAGLFNMILLIVKGVKDELSFEAFAMAPMTYLKYIAIDILVSIATGIGICLCIVPGLIVGVRLQYATNYLLDNPEAGVIEAMKYSWAITKGNFWNLVLFYLAGVGLLICGFICCCIGLFVVVPWLYFADMVIYFTIKPLEAVEEPQTENLIEG